MQHFKEAFSKHMRQPSGGPVGWLVKRFLEKRNDGLERQAAKLLNIKPHHNVLEVGFGPGLGLKHALNYMGPGGPGKVYGLNISTQMVGIATKRFQSHIAAGKLQVTVGSVADLPYADRSMDGIFHVNCYYFWDDMNQACAELHRVLSPGGVMVSTLKKKRLELLIDRGYNRYAHKLNPDEYMAVLEQTGFTGVTLEHFGKGQTTFEAIFAYKEAGGSRSAVIK
ncbi:putative methyltransferase YdaC isoform X2 [Branchiostoma floridae x Branchiostoma japonicum]